MRIIYFLPDVEAGVARIVKNIINNRPAESTVQYAVVLFRAVDNKSQPVINNFYDAEVFKVEYDHQENIFATFRRLKKCIYTETDIIVANDGFELRMAVALKIKNPIVYIIHGDFDYYYHVISLNQKILNLIITYSTAIDNKIRKLLPQRSDLVQKIYYPALAQPLPITRRKRVSSAPFRILFAGTLNERKGANLLYDIFMQLLALDLKNFELKIMGEGELYQSLLSSFSTHAAVTITGWQPAEVILKAMTEADVFLFPSNAEGLPNVLIEALSAGAVPVASNLKSGVADVITDKVNGILVQPLCRENFANAIFELYKNPAQLTYLRSNSGIGLERFDLSAQAAGYEKAILQAGKQNDIRERIFPSYSMGRVLNKNSIPNFIVKFLRKIIRHPQF